MIVGKHEHDHFPLPRAAGGKHTVVACLPCHNQKDRIRFAEWPSGSLVDFIPGFTTDADQVRAFAWIAELGRTGDITNWPSDAILFMVGRLDPGNQRLWYAKMFALVAHVRIKSSPKDTAFFEQVMFSGLPDLAREPDKPSSSARQLACAECGTEIWPVEDAVWVHATDRDECGVTDAGRHAYHAACVPP